MSQASIRHPNIATEFQLSTSISFHTAQFLGNPLCDLPKQLCLSYLFLHIATLIRLGFKLSASFIKSNVSFFAFPFSACASVRNLSELRIPVKSSFLFMEFMMDFCSDRLLSRFQFEKVAHSPIEDFVYISTAVSRKLKETQHLTLVSQSYRPNLCPARSHHA